MSVGADGETTATPVVAMFICRSDVRRGVAGSSISVGLSAAAAAAAADIVQSTAVMDQVRHPIVSCWT